MPRTRKTSTRKAAVSDAEALRLVMDLMAIPGRSGEEGAVAERIRSELLAVGAPADAIKTDNTHRRSPLGGEVGNLILKLPGTVRAARRMFVAHIDTVSVCLGSRPVRKGGTIRSADRATGLGADNRAGAAVLLASAQSVLRGKLPHPPLTFLWPVQEEAGLHGARLVRRSLLGRPRLAFNFDGGSPAKLTIGATGGYRMTIHIRGLASHAGNAPAEGISAIAIASLAIADLVKNGWHGNVQKSGRSGTSNVGVIHGGEATNVVTDSVDVRAEARSHDPKFRERIVREIRRAFERAARSVKSSAGQRGEVDFQGQLDYESFCLSADEPCVTAAADAVRSAGVEPVLAVANGGLDANWLSAHGIPTVSLGCGQRKIHTIAEELDVADFHLARRIALRLATDGESS